MPAPWVLLALAAAFACNRPQAAPRAQPTPAAAELDARHACLAPERPSAAIRLAPVFDGLETKAPVALVQAPQLAGEASGRWFVVDQRGYARSLYATDKGRVLIKNFSRSGPLFETRFYVRHADGEYSGYSYAWLEDGKDARLVQETEVRKVQGSTWIFPGMDACNQCHTAAAGRHLGLERAQLGLPEAGGSQLARFEKSGILSNALPSSSRAFSTAASWPVAERARTYLHVNCSSCQRPRGSARGGFDLRFNTHWSDTGLCDDAQLGSVDAPGQHAKLLAPGKPQDSVLLSRMARRGAHQIHRSRASWLMNGG